MVIPVCDSWGAALCRIARRGKCPAAPALRHALERLPYMLPGVFLSLTVLSVFDGWFGTLVLLVPTVRCLLTVTYHR